MLLDEWLWWFLERYYCQYQCYNENFFMRRGGE